MPQKIKKTKKNAMEDFIKKVQKRDKSIVSFDFERIVKAINKAMKASTEGSEAEARMVAHKVLADLVRIAKKHKNFLPTVEGIQDTVEKELMLSEYINTAKNYIIYRQERTRLRAENTMVSPEVKQKIAESSKYFATSYQEFIFYQFYSRWRDELGRRETWVEAIDRFMDYMKENMGSKLTNLEYEEVREAILNQEICPSMRLLWSAGKACRKTNVCSYNCAYIAPTTWRDLSEIMYVSMCGAGCGYSVEPENVEKFPQIQKQTGKMAPKIVVEDDKVSWCKAFVSACEAWEKGFDVEIDYKGLKAMAKSVKEVRHLVEEFTLKNGHKITCLAQGRLVNLSLAEGHPSEVMDTSFCGQALACEYAARNKGKMKPEVIQLPEEIDNTIAKLKLEAYGVNIDELDEEQIKYLNSWEEGT